MRVGSLVFATQQGLGYLAKSFYDAGVVTDVMVVKHGRREEQPWYPGAERIADLKRRRNDILDFCSSVNVMLFFETPFDWSLLDACRMMGTKTVLMPMYECTPDPLPSTPDLFLCPSLLDYDVFEQFGTSVHLPVPVEGVEWKLRERAEVFVHNAGHGGLRGRNGTAELLSAIPLVKSPAKFVLRCQDPHLLPTASSSRVEVQRNAVPWNELYSVGDVFVFPHKFDGLSLPLQEARASGMAVMAVDRHPDASWLPNELLLPVQSYVRTKAANGCATIDAAVLSPRDIAAKIDEWYGRDVSKVSRDGKAYAEANNWASLKPRYMEVLKCMK